MSQLVWFKKSLLVMRYWPLYDISQSFVIEFVPSAVHSLTDYPIPSKKIFHINPDVYSIWWVLTVVIK